MILTLLYIDVYIVIKALLDCVTYLQSTFHVVQK